MNDTNKKRYCNFDDGGSCWQALGTPGLTPCLPAGALCTPSFQRSSRKVSDGGACLRGTARPLRVSLGCPPAPANDLRPEEKTPLKSGLKLRLQLVPCVRIRTRMAAGHAEPAPRTAGHSPLHWSGARVSPQAGASRAIFKQECVCVCV